MGCRKCQTGEIPILHGNAEHFSQFIDEAAGSGGTCLVHLVVNDDAVALDDQLGVLAADLNDVRFRVYFCGRSCLRRNLVLN